MKQDPIALKDLIAAAHKLPDPNTSEFQEVSILIKDSITSEQEKTLLFTKWARIENGKSTKFWVLWHSIAVK
jgi:hypothetical protein